MGVGMRVGTRVRGCVSGVRDSGREGGATVVIEEGTAGHAPAASPLPKAQPAQPILGHCPSAVPSSSSTHLVAAQQQL